MLGHSKEHSLLARYLFAAALALVAAALQWGIFHLIGPRLPFLFFLPALTFSAMLFGRGPGFLAVAIGLANGALMFPPSLSLVVASLSDCFALGAYALTGTLLVTVCSKWRLTSLRAAEVEK